VAWQGDLRKVSARGRSATCGGVSAGGGVRSWDLVLQMVPWGSSAKGTWNPVHFSQLQVHLQLS
jgi:hypothetical protein